MTNTTSFTRLLIADDHSVTRTGLKFLLKTYYNVDQFYDADSCAATVQMLSLVNFSHAILDLQLGDGNIFDLFQTIKKNHPDTAFLIYSEAAEEVFGKRLIQMGAMGFLSKTASEKEVLHALKLFLNNKMYISSNLLSVISGNTAKNNTISDNPFQDLSKREMEVINYILKGVKIKDIAEKLQIGITTVATYKSRIFDKFSVTNSMDLKNLANQFHFEGN